MKYKVTWKVTKYVTVSCPDRNEDPYTGEISMISCAVAHFKTVEEFKEKVFNSRKEAEAFIENAPKNNLVDDFKLYEEI